MAWTPASGSGAPSQSSNSDGPKFLRCPDYTELLSVCTPSHLWLPLGISHHQAPMPGFPWHLAPVAPTTFADLHRGGDRNYCH